MPGENTEGQVPENEPAATAPGSPPVAGAEAQPGAAAALPSAAPASPEGGVVLPSEAPATPQPPAAVGKHWAEMRLAQRTAQFRETEARLAQVEAELAAAKAGTPVDTATFEAKVASAAEARARELAAAQAFQAECNKVADAGRAAFPDFAERIGQLVEVAGVKDGGAQAQATYANFLNAAMETGEAPRLLHELGGDPNEAARIMALSPVKMAMELGRRAAKAPAPPVSAAPKPITPIGSRGGQHEAVSAADPRADALSTREWMERRDAEVKARRRA